MCLLVRLVVTCLLGVSCGVCPHPSVGSSSHLPLVCEFYVCLFLVASHPTPHTPPPTLPNLVEVEAGTILRVRIQRRFEKGGWGCAIVCPFVRPESYLLDSLPVVVLVGGTAVSMMLRPPPTALRLSAGEAREHVFAVRGRSGGCVGVRGVEGGGGGAGGFWESAEEMAGVGLVGFGEGGMVGGVKELDAEEDEDDIERIESASEAESEGLYHDPSCGGGVEWDVVDGAFEGRDGWSGIGMRRRMRSWSSPASGSGGRGGNEETGMSVVDGTDERFRRMAGRVDGRFAVMEGTISVDEAEESTCPAIGSNPTAPAVDETQQGTVRRSVRRRRAETLFGYARHSSEPAFPEHRAQRLALANHLDQAVDNSRPPQVQTLGQSVNSSLQEGGDSRERSVQSMRRYDGSRLDYLAQHYQMMRRGAGAESFETPRSARSVHGLRMPMFGSAVETPPGRAFLAGEEAVLLESRWSHLSEVPQLSLDAAAVEGLDGLLDERHRTAPRSLLRYGWRQLSQRPASRLHDWSGVDLSVVSSSEQQVARSVIRTMRPSRGSAFEIYEDTIRGAEIARERRAGMDIGWRYHRLRDSPENVLAPEHSREQTRLGDARRAFLAMSLEEGGGVLLTTPPRVGRYDRLGQSDPDIESFGQGDGE